MLARFRRGDLLDGADDDAPRAAMRPVLHDPIPDNLAAAAAPQAQAEADEVAVEQDRVGLPLGREGVIGAGQFHWLSLRSGNAG